MLKRYFISFIFITTKILAQDFTEFSEFVETARTERQIPGAAVVIVQKDKVLFLKGFGILRLGSKEKVDENTIFQVASITKTFTAAALGVQVDQGLLTWDDEVITHLPQFALKDPYASRFASARDLLAHRTGLPTFCGDLFDKLGYSRDEILYRIRFIEPATSFRNRAHYSNIGFFVAGQLLGKFTNSWEEGVQNTLFIPLGMHRSGFSDNLDNSNVAAAHAILDGKLQVIPWNRLQGLSAAGAITTSAADMAKWMSMLLNQGKQILKPETIEEMFKPSMVGKISFFEAAPISKNTGFDFGLGWECYNYKGYRIVEKGGTLQGTRAVITLIPELNIGITVLSNLNLTYFPEAVRAEFLEMIIGKSDMDLQEKIATLEIQMAERVKGKVKLKKKLPLGHELAQYTGVFKNTLYGDVIIEIQDNQLVLKAGSDGWKGKLTHFSNDTFTLTWPAINSSQQVTFMFGPDDTAISFQTEALGDFQRNK